MAEHHVESTPVGSSDHIARVTYAIYGLGCWGGGAATVEHALTRTSGVNRAYINPLTEMAYVDYDSDVCGAQALMSAVKGACYRTGEPGHHIRV